MALTLNCVYYKFMWISWAKDWSFLSLQHYSQAQKREWIMGTIRKGTREAIKQDLLCSLGFVSFLRGIGLPGIRQCTIVVVIAVCGLRWDHPFA